MPDNTGVGCCVVYRRRIDEFEEEAHASFHVDPQDAWLHRSYGIAELKSQNKKSRHGFPQRV